MHPNVFLKTFWQMEVKPEVFVAMSFHEMYEERYQKVIKPAIEEITLPGGVKLNANRVDTSKSGDSILTDIMDGVAHSQFILADVSTMGCDSKTNYAYRNGNVMYEVGLALACRQPCDVLLIRDDHDSFLFDVSTIPHMTIDFSNSVLACSVLHQKIVERLREQQFTDDARATMAFASLTVGEFERIVEVGHVAETGSFGVPPQPLGNEVFGRLLDKQIIRYVGIWGTGEGGKYVFTSIGKVVARMVLSCVEKLTAK